MSMQGWKKWALAVGVCLLLGLCSAQAEAMPGCEVGGMQIHAQESKAGTMLFLPSFTDLTQLELTFEDESVQVASAALSLTVRQGEKLDLTAFFPDGPDEEGIYRLAVNGKALGVMRSANQASLFLLSHDPVNHGRLYLEDTSASLKRSIPADMVMLDPEGEVVYNGALRQLSGRGNTTWNWGPKKPYQIKLEDRTDLLQSGNVDNRQRTWALLAEGYDSTLAHNPVCLSLGHELGLMGTPEFRPVDLYFDGEYRGYYLLCEKVQAKPGRLDILETQKYMEELYPQLDNREWYPLVMEQSEIGEYQYVQGVETVLGNRAGWLIECDHYGYEYGESWFKIGWRGFEIREPSHVSKTDVLYIQEKVDALLTTINAGGVHPETKQTLAEQIDLDSLARVLLINQFAKNVDYGYTSTYLYLPENSDVFYAGPIWDFDITFSIRNNREYEFGVEGYVGENEWTRKFLNSLDVQEAMRKVWKEEMEPLLKNVLLGGEESAFLRSLESYRTQNEASRRMNYMLWDYGGEYNNIYYPTLYDTFEENWAFFVDYVERRFAWMSRDVDLWSGHEIEKADVFLSYINADVPASASAVPGSAYQNYKVTDVSWEMDREAGDELWHALYTVDITLKANEGIRFVETPEVLVNGDPAELLSCTENEAKLRFRFMGPFYEPAVYEDFDYGLLYQYDYFIDQCPEVYELYEGDRELTLEEYVWYYLPYEISAIETFDYQAYYDNYPRLLENYFFSDPMASTLFYVENDQNEPMLGLSAPVYPTGWNPE